jgi:hypothetical protein
MALYSSIVIEEPDAIEAGLVGSGEAEQGSEIDTPVALPQDIERRPLRRQCAVGTRTSGES